MKACRGLNVTPHVAPNSTGLAAVLSTGARLATRATPWACAPGSASSSASAGARRGPLAQVMVRGLEKVDQLLTLAMDAYNLIRLRALAELRPQVAR